MVGLTQGAISKIMSNGSQVAGFQPTVQVMNIRKMGGADRFRLVLSDGAHYQHCMLATQQSQLVTSNELVEHCLITLEEFLVNEVKGKQIIIGLTITVVPGGPVPKIGEPVHVENPSDTLSGFLEGNEQQTGYGRGNNYSAPAANSYRAPASSNAYGGSQSSSNPYQRGGMEANQGNGGGYGRSSGPVARADPGTHYTPLSSLNPYQNRWTIKARVTFRSDIRRWQNQRGEGWLCSIDLLDSEGGEIRAAFFKEACDKFYNMLEPGKVFTFSGGKVKVANKQYTSFKNDYELNFDTNAEIIPVAGDDDSIQQQMFNFTSICDMEQVEVNNTTDVIGIVKDMGNLDMITTKAGRDCEKLNLTLVDEGNTELRLTLWGAHAKTAEETVVTGCVLAVKNCKVSDFSGRSLSSMRDSTVTKNPDVQQTHDLQTWWNNFGSTASFKSMSTAGGGGGGDKDSFASRKTVSAIKDENLGHSDNTDYISFKGTVTFIKHDNENGPWYTACPSKDCKKKVTEALDNGWVCEKCNKTYPDCERRYILSMICSDFTGNTWLTAFDDTALVLLDGKTANELYQWRANGQDGPYENAFQEALWVEVVLRCRVKAEMVKDENRIKVSAMSLRKVDYERESADLVNAIYGYE